MSMPLYISDMESRFYNTYTKRSQIMKKSLYLRLVCMVIAALMLFCTFVACADSGDDTPDDGADTTTPTADVDDPAVSGDDQPTETTPSDIDENGFKKDDVPEDLQFPDKTITMLTWSDVEHEEFMVEEQTGDNVADAIFYRNLTIEERLGITMDFVSTEGDSGYMAAWTKYIQTSIQAGGGEFDVTAGYSRAQASAASKGLLYDLLDDGCEYLNFDMPWWPNKLIDEATINDKLYFASGDISANALYMMYVVFVNTKILTDVGLESVYSLVDNNKWTYDKFIQMCSNVYIDQDGSGDKSVGDRFGYMTSGIHTDPWFYGSGALIVDKDAQGNLQFAESFKSERTISALEKINGLLHNTSDGIYTPDTEHQREFDKGNLLFATDRCRIAITRFESEDLEYSIAPFPKFDEAQENYVTVMGNPFTLYALPIDSKDDELPMLSAFLEVYASESYRQLTPQLFEVSIKVKYTQDNDAARMYDIIRESLCFDIGRIFDSALIGQGAWRNAVKNNMTNWASSAKQYERIMNKKLGTLIEAYEG